jgi:hypothetical protein
MALQVEVSAADAALCHTLQTDFTRRGAPDLDAFEVGEVLGVEVDQFYAFVVVDVANGHKGMRNEE